MDASLTSFTKLTEAQVIAGTPKQCTELPCPTFEDRRLDVAVTCITGSFLQDVGYRENVATLIDGLTLKHELEVNRDVISQILTEAGAAIVIPAQGAGGTGETADASAVVVTGHTDKTPIIDDVTFLRSGAYNTPSLSQDRRRHYNANFNLYANQAAYKSHLQTPHFLHYKTTTLKMVKSLKLVDMDAIDPGNMNLVFKNWGANSRRETCSTAHCLTNCSACFSCPDAGPAVCKYKK